MPVEKINVIFWLARLVRLYELFYGFFAVVKHERIDDNANSFILIFRNSIEFQRGGLLDLEGVGPTSSNRTKRFSMSQAIKEGDEEEDEETVTVAKSLSYGCKRRPLA